MSTETDTTYNGWKNYPTWNVALWIDNDEGLYRHRVALMEAFAIEKAPRHEIADSIKAWVTYDLAPDLGASFAADLLGYALDEVDWHEIADNWMSE